MAIKGLCCTAARLVYCAFGGVGTLGQYEYKTSGDWWCGYALPYCDNEMEKAFADFNTGAVG